MRFSTRSKVSILLSLVTIVAIVCAFMVTVFSHGASHAATGSSAASSTTVLGTAAPAATGDLSKAPTTAATGSATFNTDIVNRMGVNSTIPSTGSGAPSATATALSSSTAASKWHSSNAGNLLQSFDGVSDRDNAMTTGFILAPPDQGLCVGPLAAAGGQTVVFEPVNISYRIMSTTGTTLFGPAPDSFLFNEPAFPTEFISDPRCQFDKATGDFFFTILAFNFPAQTLSHIDVTVLHQNGAFFTYRFDTTDPGGRGCPCFADQPLLGIDAFNLYVSGNEFPIMQPSPIFNGAEVYAISKSQLAANVTANFAEISNISDQGILIETLQPAITYDANAPAEYLLHSFVVDANGNNTSFDHRLGVFAITNQAAVTAGGFPTLSNPTVINSELYAQPNTAPQPNGLNLNADDDRMQQVEYINGNLMGALSTAILVKGDTTPRDGAAWFDIEPSLHGSLTVKARIKHQGYIAASGLYILYPAILQAADGTVEMSFSITNGTTNPSAAYAVVPDGKHSSNAGAIFVAATGNGSYHDTFTCTGTLSPGCRWGDYSWITLDPSSNNFWMGSEYVPPVARQISNANWGTRVYEVSG
jgi:hypothetical protein